MLSGRMEHPSGEIYLVEKSYYGLANRFGQLLVLEVPKKSHIIVPNTATPSIQYAEFGSPPQRGDAVFKVPSRNRGDDEHELRIRNVRRRLLTATSVATSVANRMLILNTYVLPAVFFTVAVFRILWLSASFRTYTRSFMEQLTDLNPASYKNWTRPRNRRC
ncbi:unnamed protein product [Peronospora belbahrii]|uniref:Uncharacterized protein n=1 Tax=Peronospora belbahrii TaxID=622444 RepID=A0AAU9LCT5_9STRA|nr:unnamed protein product [Peronospora belbahrii]